MFHMHVSNLNWCASNVISNLKWSFFISFSYMLSLPRFSLGKCKWSCGDYRLSKMTSLPCVPCHLMWYIVCKNWLKFTHTQGNVDQRSCVLAKLALLSLLKILLPLVLAKEMYVGSLLRSPYGKQSMEIYSQKNLVEI